MRAPVSSRPSILDSPTLPAPTTRTCFPSSLINIGKRLVTDTSCCLDQRLWRREITRHRRNGFSGQKFPQFRVAVPREKAAQILARLAVGEISTEQTLEGLGHFTGEAAIAHRPRRGLMETQSPADAEVIRVKHAAIDFELFAFDADVGDPVLTATVRASRDVQFQVLIETGKPFIEFVDE